MRIKRKSPGAHAGANRASKENAQCNFTRSQNNKPPQCLLMEAQHMIETLTLVHNLSYHIYLNACRAKTKHETLKNMM